MEYSGVFKKDEVNQSAYADWKIKKKIFLIVFRKKKMLKSPFSVISFDK